MSDEEVGRLNRFLPAELREGMRFSAPVFFDDGENMFLPENTRIRKRHLAALERWEIPFVLSWGRPLPDELSGGV